MNGKTNSHSGSPPPRRCSRWRGPCSRPRGPTRRSRVANYPVDATAQNAVAAKEKAIADGQQAAFRSLLKRLVPVTSFNKLGQLKSLSATNLVDGVAVRASATRPRNTSPRWISRSIQARCATCSAGRAFRSSTSRRRNRHRAGLRGAGGQPPSVVAEATDTWTYAWRALDLVNTLTPATLAEAKREIHPETLNSALAGDSKAHRVIAGEYQTSLVILAVLEPSADGKKATVTLTGQDSVGTFTLARSYRLDGDLAYTSELAAVVGLGVLEGRWKSANGHLMTASAPDSYGRVDSEVLHSASAPQPHRPTRRRATPTGPGRQTPRHRAAGGSSSSLRLSTVLPGQPASGGEVVRRPTATPGGPEHSDVEAAGLHAARTHRAQFPWQYEPVDPPAAQGLTCAAGPMTCCSRGGQTAAIAANSDEARGTSGV